MIDYKILNCDEYNEIENLDRIRIKAYGHGGSDYYINRIKDNKLSAIEVLLDNIVIGGAYVYISPNTYSLNIDQIFILEEYRHKDYASLLIDYIINNKNIFEDIYGIKVNKSIVEPGSKDLESFYKLNGYSGHNIMGGMTRFIDYENKKKI